MADVERCLARPGKPPIMDTRSLLLPRRAWLAALFGAALFATASAQTGTDPNWMPYSDSVGTALKLTPEQRKSMADIDRRYHAQYDKLGNDGLRQEQYPTMQQQRDRDIQEALGPQYTQWQELDKHYVPGTVQPLPNNGGRPGVDQQGPPTLPPTPQPPPPTPMPGTPTK